MSRQINPDASPVVFKRRNEMVCAADVAMDVALRVRQFQERKPIGAVYIDADKPMIDPSCPKQKARALEIYEAIGSDGMIPYTKDDARWLARFNEAMYRANEGNS